MDDARCLAEHFEHVEIAIRVKGVAGVVTGDRDGNAGGVEFVQRRDTAPPGGTDGRAILQVHVAHRQRHDGDAGLAELIDDALTVGIGFQRQTATMSGDDATFEPGADCRIGDGFKSCRMRAVAFVDVQVKIETVCGGGGQSAVERQAQFRIRRVAHERQTAELAAVFGDSRDD